MRSGHLASPINLNLHRADRSGVALVIVLAMVVLVTGLIVAFFSRAIMSRQVSNSSAAQAKADLLAQSAVDSIVGDFKSQIALASSTMNVSGNIIYLTNSNTGMVPTRYGVFAMSGTAPNLICYSTRTGTSNLTGTSIVFITGSASPVNSGTDVSVNGISVSPSRWNSHYLLPLSNTSNTINTAPVALSSGSTFAPDWVYFTRGGPAVLGTNSYTLGSSTTSINNPIASNTNYVIGRYAYAVYDEGGLLDMNVAGYPQNLYGTQAPAYKSSLALADLTQIGLATADINNIVGWRNYASGNATGNFPTGPVSFSDTTSWIDNFVLSNTTGHLTTGTFSNSGFTDQAFLSRQQLIKMFTQALPAAPGSAGLANLQSALQYLGTFSRGLEQPSYIKPSTLPIITGTGLPPTPPNNGPLPAGSYQGNNTCWGGDSVINLTGSGFLSARVGAAFQRSDGTQAVAGEPLVKKRFALKRLAWLTYKGPSASNLNDPVVQNTITQLGGNPSNSSDPIYQYVAQGTAQNIYNCFGLSWVPDPRNPGSYLWVYSHQGAAPLSAVPTSGTTIATLQGGSNPVSGREPDFVELLKAAINVGSLGKAAPNGVGYDYQYTLDKSVDFQILQITANLIDQFKPDSFPATIAFQDSTSATAYTRYFYGAEDLPYFYRWHGFNICTKVPIISGLPNSQVSKNDSITLQNYPVASHTNPVITSNQSITITSARYLGPSRAIQESGTVTMLLIPEVWNLHDPNMPTTGSRPAQFRIVAVTDDPLLSTSAWTINAMAADTSYHFQGWGTASTGSGSSETTLFPVPLGPNGTYLGDPLPSASIPLSSSNASLTFTDKNGQLFHEPTLLWRSNVPSGINLQAVTNSTYKDVLSNQTYTGIFIGQVPAAWQVTFAPTWTGTISNNANNSATDPTLSGSANPVPTYVFQATALHKGPDQTPPSGAINDCLTFRLQYKDGSGNWIDYDVKYSPYGESPYGDETVYVNQYDWQTNQEYLNPLTNVNGNTATMLYWPCGSYDPRSPRFSMYAVGAYATDDPSTNGGSPTLEVPTMVNNNPPTLGQNQTVNSSNFVLMATRRPGLTRGQYDYYDIPCGSGTTTNAPMRWYSSPGWDANATNVIPSASHFFDGLLCQNNPLQQTLGADNKTLQSEYYEDPDGVCRRAMAGYVPISNGTNAATPIGMPLITIGTTFTSGTVNPTTQSQSRPIILHRPFRNVAEMSYAFRGGPWKNIDFFTPESGDVALLDVFCINEPPSNPLVAGKLNLNTRQEPVLQAILAGAYRDELATNALPALASSEAANIANLLVGITTGTQAWRGPLTNVADLIGHYVPTPGVLSGTDYYQCPYHDSTTGLTLSGTYTFAGFSAALSGTSTAQDGSDIWTNNSISSRNIQRFRESAIRPLVDCGQTRVWNLMIDVIAQTGKYPPGLASGSPLSQFYVEGEKRYWIHVAIDRLTGQILDRQLEPVTQ